MKLICQPSHHKILLEKLYDYKELDIVLVEKGMDYQGLSYYFDYDHLDDLLNYLETLKSQKTLIGYINQRMYPIQIKDIIYIEGFSKACYLHTLDKEYESEYKLHELEELLQGTSIIRIHKSVLVNICYIDYILSEPNMKYGLYMKSNIKLTLSRKYVLDFKKKIGKR